MYIRCSFFSLPLIKKGMNKNFFPDWWILLKQEKVLLFDCIEREGDLKDTQRNTQNATLNVDLL